MHARIEAPVERGGWDGVVIGSGFGGTMAARELVRAGWRVLMLERGDWVARGPHNWAPHSVGPLTDAWSTATPYRVLAGGDREWMGAFECVGGPSVFYGGVSLRLRERNFEPAPEIVGDSGARWPFGYRELEPYYTRAERLLGVAGDDGGDPTAPPRSAGYPHPPAALTPTSRRIWEGARRLGLEPFRLPLALNHGHAGGRRPCAACGTCDLFACAISAKNDLATAVLPELIERGLFYFGDTDPGAPAGKLGGIQQLPTPPPELVKEHLPPGLGRLVSPLLGNVIGLLTMTEDQPHPDNGVSLDPARRDRFGLPQLVVRQRPSARDLAAGAALVRHSRRVLREAGALVTRLQAIRTFSHAVGTLRAGDVQGQPA